MKVDNLADDPVGNEQNLFKILNVNNESFYIPCFFRLFNYVITIHQCKYKFILNDQKSSDKFNTLSEDIKEAWNSSSNNFDVFESLWNHILEIIPLEIFSSLSFIKFETQLCKRVNSTIKT